MARKLVEDSPPICYCVPIKWLAPVLVPVMIVGGITFLVVTSLTHGVWLLPALWLALMGWIGFNFIWLLPFEVVVSNGKMTWKGYLRTYTFSVSDVLRITNALQGNVQVIELRGGRKLRIGVMQGYRQFIERLSGAYPDILVDTSAYATYVDRLRLRRNRATRSNRSKHN